MLAIGLIFGVAVMVLAITLFVSNEYEWGNGKAWIGNLIALCVSVFIVAATFVVYNHPLFKMEYIIMREAAPLIDKYAEEHPDSIYNPDQLLSISNDLVIDFATSIKGLPDMIKGVTGMTPEEIELEKIKIQNNRDMAEFEAWKLLKAKSE
jgi:hypothetical protein